MASVDETMHGCMLICMNTSVLAEPPTFAAAVPTHDSATSQAARGHQESTLLAAFFQDVLLDLSTYLRLVVFLPPSSVTSATTRSQAVQSEEEMEEIRRGPWTTEEDLVLIKYVAQHGEGRWNALARCAGLKRTGKSCRLRWLNYLRPDVRRGNITPEEQLLILDLHSRWGNRWSKIAQCLPGRTDNEIKNYWRTRVQKHAKQLHCDVNSTTFKDAIRYMWMPRLLERIRAASGGAAFSASCSSPVATATAAAAADPLPSHPIKQPERATLGPETVESSPSEDSLPTPFSCFADCHSTTMQGWGGWAPDSLSLPVCCDEQGGWPSGDLLSSESLWSMEDDWFMQHQIQSYQPYC
ncbi:unnamed protein product [Musa acuminata subsp. burmannicoides]